MEEKMARRDKRKRTIIEEAAYPFSIKSTFFTVGFIVFLAFSDIHQTELLHSLLSRPILSLPLFPLLLCPLTFVPLVDDLFRDTVQLLAWEDSEQGPGEIERVLDTSVLVDSLLDKCVFEFVQELESELGKNRGGRISAVASSPHASRSSSNSPSLPVTALLHRRPPS
jgi:hypothetical protein